MSWVERWLHHPGRGIEAPHDAGLRDAHRGIRAEAVVVLNVTVVRDEDPHAVGQGFPHPRLVVPAGFGDAAVAVAVRSVRVAAVGAELVVPLAVRVVELLVAVATVAGAERFAGRRGSEQQSRHQQGSEQQQPELVGGGQFFGFHLGSLLWHEALQYQRFST